MAKWFSTYEQALAWVCRNGFPYDAWNATPSGWHYFKGQAASITEGEGASEGMFLAVTSF